MEACQSLYFLCEKISAMNWREKQFFQEIHKRGKETFLQRIRKIEIPQNVPREDSWQEQAEKWNWSHMGALVRNETKKEMSYGSVV